MKKFVLAFVIFALAVAFAGTVSSSHSYTITLLRPASVCGNQLAAGDYRLTIASDKVTVVANKKTIELAAKIVTTEKKFDDTTVVYAETKLAEIRLGGTKTKIVLAQ